MNCPARIEKSGNLPRKNIFENNFYLRIYKKKKQSRITLLNNIHKLEVTNFFTSDINHDKIIKKKESESE